MSDSALNISGSLKQLQLRFDAEQDRLVFRLNTSSGDEVRFWLTRRLVKAWWPCLEQFLRKALEGTQEQREARVQFERDAARAGADTTTPFADQAKSYPMGEQPRLLRSISHRRNDKGRASLGFVCVDNSNLNVPISDKMLHNIKDLLKKTCAATQWDIELPDLDSNTSVKAVH